jgi:hypothetical protein
MLENGLRLVFILIFLAKPMVSQLKTSILKYIDTLFSITHHWNQITGFYVTNVCACATSQARKGVAGLHKVAGYLRLGN